MHNKTCGNCKFFEPHSGLSKKYWDEDAPGSCNWNPPPLPISWEYAVRSIVWVKNNLPAYHCACWERREPEE